MYRLTSETRTGTPSYSRTYGYDLAGNPTTINSTTVAAYDSANKLTTIQSKAVTNDNDGNITAITSPSPLSFSSLSWDLANKPTRIYIPAGTYDDFNYMYDGKRYYSRPVLGSRVFYIFAGDTLLGEITTSTPTIAYSWGPDGLISKRNLSASTSSWYEFGPQEETRTLTNGSGSLTDTYYYNAYGGEIISSSGSTANPYRYGGKFGYYTESFTGLVLATQRWYSPQLMRWISRDPIRYKGGVNLYEYVESRPVQFRDFSGKKGVSNTGGNSLILPAWSEPGMNKMTSVNQCNVGGGDIPQCLQACSNGMEAAQSYCTGIPEPNIRALCYAAAAAGTLACEVFCYGYMG